MLKQQKPFSTQRCLNIYLRLNYYIKKENLLIYEMYLHAYTFAYLRITLQKANLNDT